MIHILVLIHAGTRGIDGLRAYEAQVLSILREHGGKLLSAFKPRGWERPGHPDEIHLIEFASEEAFAAYRADPRIGALANVRSGAISQAEIYVSDEMVSYFETDTSQDAD